MKEVVIVLFIFGALGVGVFKIRRNLYDKYGYDLMGVLNNILAFATAFLLVGGVYAMEESIFIGIMWMLGGVACLGALAYRHIKNTSVGIGTLFTIAHILAVAGIVVVWVVLKALRNDDQIIFGNKMHNTSNTRKKPVKRGMTEAEYYQSQGIEDEIEAIHSDVPSYEGTKAQEDYAAYEKENKEAYYN